MAVRGWDHVEHRPILDGTFLLFEEDHGMRCATCDRVVLRGQPYQAVPTGMYENGDSMSELRCVYCVTGTEHRVPGPPVVHEAWPAEDAAALRAVLTDCPPHLDPISAMWGASTALLRRRTG